MPHRFYNHRRGQIPSISVKPSTGRAECQKCHNKIQKETAQLFISFRSAFGQKEQHYHMSCVINEGKEFMSDTEMGSLLSIREWSSVIE